MQRGGPSVSTASGMGGIAGSASEEVGEQDQMMLLVVGADCLQA